MSLAPLPTRGPRTRLLSSQTEQRRRIAPTTMRLLRRRWRVRILKYVLPIVGLVLLASIVVWPELARLEDQERLTLRQLATAEIDTGEVVDPHYRGVDDRNQPYTVTAAQARQAGPSGSGGADRVNLVDPKGDLLTSGNSWILVTARRGVYMQHAQLLDLSDNVVLYRDDGTTLYTDSATMDLHEGAAVGNAKVHAEGPFGTLDAQAFALTDKADVVQFTGPAHLVVNGADH
jgi:lipopolysaccharide export system protein LptC